MRYLGHPVPQCQQASRRFGRSDCCNNPTPGACAEGGWPQFDHWGFNFRSVRGALTFDQLQHEINANRPIAFSWLWIDGDSGHMMVALGYNISAQLVYINDPWPPRTGDARWITYASYVSQPGDHSHLIDFFEIEWNPGASKWEELMGQHHAPNSGNIFGDPEGAARDSLQMFGQLVTPETAEAMGFEATHVDPDRLSLGEPLPFMAMPLEQVRSYREGSDITKVLIDTGQLSYPVLMNDAVVSSVTVGRQDGLWTFVSLGNPNLTKGLIEARDSLPVWVRPRTFVVSIPALYAIFIAYRDPHR